ncbi:glycosyltransferase [Sphingobacterium sp. Mn56C]|uniref:glycosyltransferase n=1 Tax=Sphingobacterium sp. Mn56C TaxID=3395261 RepID=UPI003BD0330B
MKICVFVPGDKLGGAEQYLKNITVYYLKNGDDVDVYFLKSKKYNGWEDLKLFSNLRLFYTTKFKESKGALALLKKILLIKTKYDYGFSSHVHLNCFLGFLRCFRLFNVKYIVSRESTTTHKRFKGMKLHLFNCGYKLFYKYLDLLICQSQLMRDSLITNVPCLDQSVKVKVIPNPIILEDIKSKLLEPISDDIKCLGEFIVSAGRLIHLKGFDILIQSFARLENKNLKLVLLGEGSDEEKLKLLALELGVSERVIFLGFVNNVYPYFKAADACVVSSRIEGFPNVLLQMMMANENVVSTLCAGGIDDIDGLSLSKINDEELLFLAIQNVLKNSPETKKNIRSLFDKELLGRDISVFIEKVNYFLNYEKI